MESIGDFEYSKKDLIGHGAFAVVFKGRHKKTEMVVAIKSITKKNLAKSQSLLSKEIKILKELSSLQHENVVGLLECKETTHHVYLVMEFCNGGDLADYLQAKGTLSEDTIASFLRQIAGAMRALNEKGIVHRDLKPQNILLCHSGQPNISPKNMQLKIADFGFARFLQDGVMAATLCGSPMYMAPEVIMSLQYDAKADLWSVGTIVYQCLTGKAPFQAQTPQQLKQFYEKNALLQPNIPSGTSRELKTLLLQLLKRDAKERIEFDDFFKHAFLHPKPKLKSSSPVLVPRGRHTHPSASSPPSLKAVSASPLSAAANIPPSQPAALSASPMAAVAMKVPAPSRHQPDTTCSPPSDPAGGLLNVNKEDMTAGLSPVVDDFVFVPENIPSDHSVSSAGSAPWNHSPADLNTIFSADSPRQTARMPRTGSTVKKRDSLPGCEKSPSRPSSLRVNSPGSSPHAPSTEPIPVPSQVKAYEQIQRSTAGIGGAAGGMGGSPSSPLAGHMVSPASTKPGVPIARKSSNSSIPSVGSISPPSVQFTIGTPPGGAWRKPSYGASPAGGKPTAAVAVPSGKSPLRRTCSTPPHPSSATVPGTSLALPTIVGSPTKLAAAAVLWSPSAMDGELNAAVSSSLMGMRCKVKTCPDNIAAVGYYMDGRCGTSPPGSSDFSRSETEPISVLTHSSSTTRLSGQLLKAAFAANTTAVVPSSGPQPPSPSTLPAISHSPSVTTTTGLQPAVISYTGGRTRTLSSGEDSVRCVQCMPTMEGPVALVAPELVEETLMDKCHNETLSKLHFVLALVKCVVELAQSRSSPLSQSVTPTPPACRPLGRGAFSSEATRSVEQLVLYVRALHLLAAAMELARQEVTSKRLHASSNVRTLVSEMNTYYHQCLRVCNYLKCKDLTGAVRQGEPPASTITADRLIYTYAIEMCQTAALDELFGNPSTCFHRYRSAQILLHSLSQQAPSQQDKQLLNRYRESVEKRIFNLYNQEYTNAAENSS